MSLCFQSFNYSPNILKCCLSKSQVKKNPTLLNFPSSIIGAGGNFTSKSNSIGIIGGVLVDSTLSFAKKLVSMNNSEDEENGLPFVLSLDPALSKDLLSIGRNRGKNVSTQSDRISLVKNLRFKRMSLEKSGVCCIVMPCHISHTWYDEIEEGCSVPFLHMGECVANELKEANLRPIEAGSPVRIGVLATNQTLVAKFYQEKLENEGFEVIVPDKATFEHMVIPAMEALNRKDFEGAKNLFRIALQFVLVRAVNRVVIVSDELHQVLPSDDPLWNKCIDPKDSLARSAVKYGTGRVKKPY